MLGVVFLNPPAKGGKLVRASRRRRGRAGKRSNPTRLSRRVRGLPRSRHARGVMWKELVRRRGIVPAARMWPGGAGGPFRANPMFFANPLMRTARGRFARRGVRRLRRIAGGGWRNPRRRRRYARRRGYDNNPLMRTARGRFARRGVRRLRRISGGGWRNPRHRARRRRSRRMYDANPVRRRRRYARRRRSYDDNPRRRYARRRRRYADNPYSDNARRPRRRRRAGARRRRRSYSDNPYHFNARRRRRRVGARRRRSYRDNPYANDNPEDIATTLQAPLKVSFWMENVVPVVAGGLAAKIAASQLMPVLGLEYKGLQRHVGNLAASAIIGAAGFLLTKDAALAGKLLAGGLVAALGDVIYSVAGGMPMVAMTAPAMGDLDLFGATDLEKELEARIMREVESGVSQYEDPSEAVQLAQWPRERGTAAFVTREELSGGAGIGDFITAEAIQ